MVNRARPNTGRRNAAVAAATGIMAGLLFVYPTSLGQAAGTASAPEPAIGSVAGSATTSGRSSGTRISGSSGSSGTAKTSTGKTATTPAGSGSGTRTVTGSAVNTRYGPVQVELTITGSRIVSAGAIEYPTGNGRDRQINSYAVPQLNAEVLAAQSAGIDTVSGATFTSDGYLRSLQSALDAANLG
jgi:uncharacterized protein with FMN-binding domain